MKKTDKFEDNWDEKNLNTKSKLGRNLLLVGAILSGLGIYYYASQDQTASDAHLYYIKAEYDKSLNIIDSILNNPEQEYDHSQALKIKSQILLDKNSDHHSKNEGFSTLQQLFGTSPTIETARKIIQIGDDLKKTDKQLFKYTEYLAKKNDVDSILRISQYYMNNDDRRMKLKAKKYLQKLPESIEKQLSLAELELLSGTNTRTVSNAENFLNSAVFQGSSKAMIELAFLQLKKAELNKLAAPKYKAQFPIFAKRAINMGYDGDRLKEVEFIIRYGRDGVQQDLALAEIIKKIIEKNDKNTK